MIAASLPGEGKVLVKADTIGVSMPEVLVRCGTYAWMPPLPAIPGIELSGTVVVIPTPGRVPPPPGSMGPEARDHRGRSQSSISAIIIRLRDRYRPPTERECPPSPFGLR